MLAYTNKTQTGDLPLIEADTDSKYQTTLYNAVCHQRSNSIWQNHTHKLLHQVASFFVTAQPAYVFYYYELLLIILFLSSQLCLVLNLSKVQLIT